jgi:histidine triad (HIT) family protein
MLEDFREKLKGMYIEKVKGECVFCHLLDEEDDKIIYRNENIAVFPPLKSGALKEGHLLVVPVNHHNSLFDMNHGDAKEYFGELHSFMKKLEANSRYSAANLLSANGKAAQQSINHLHFHLVLREQDENYNLWPETDYSGEKFEPVNKELKNLLN